MGVVKCLAFDLDGTLADSKQPISKKMAKELGRLMNDYTVAVITGGKQEQVQVQVANRLENEVGLEVFSCSGATYHIYDWNGPQKIYEYDIKYDDVLEIQSQIEKVARELGFWVEVTHGPSFEYRGSQLTWSACGQLAAVEVKSGYDPDGSRRKAIIERLNLVGFTARIGGMSSIDVSLSGFDKSYAIQTLLKSGYTADEIIYFGDQFGEDGNDSPVKMTGVRCVEVKNWGETLKWLQDF